MKFLRIAALLLLDALQEEDRRHSADGHYWLREITALAEMDRSEVVSAAYQLWARRGLQLLPMQSDTEVTGNLIRATDVLVRAAVPDANQPE